MPECWVFFHSLWRFCSHQKGEYMRSIMQKMKANQPTSFLHLFHLLLVAIFLEMQLPAGEADIPGGWWCPILPVLYWAEFGGEEQSYVKIGNNSSCTALSGIIWATRASGCVGVGLQSTCFCHFSSCNKWYMDGLLTVPGS